MAASETDKFKKVGASTVTTLSAPGKAIGATSITVGSTTNYPTDTGIVFAIRVVDADGELVAGTYTEWIGTVTSGTTLSMNATPVYGSDQIYPAGSTTQVYIPLSSDAHNDMIDGLLAEHNQDGTHSDITATSATFTGNIDINDSSTAIRDTSDNELLKFAKTASAVNEITVGNAATGGDPYLSATGGDTDIDFAVNAKGTGDLMANGLPMGAKAWQTWTPTWTNVTVGNGTTIAKYIQIGKTIHLRVVFTFGSTTSFTGTVSFSLPVTAADYGHTSSGSPAIGILRCENNASTNNIGAIQMTSTTSCRPVSYGVAGSLIVFNNINSTTPFTWGTGDELIITGTYEAA